MMQNRFDSSVFFTLSLLIIVAPLRLFYPYTLLHELFSFFSISLSTRSLKRSGVQALAQQTRSRNFLPGKQPFSAQVRLFKANSRWENRRKHYGNQVYIKNYLIVDLDRQLKNENQTSLPDVLFSFHICMHTWDKQ